MYRSIKAITADLIHQAAVSTNDTAWRTLTDEYASTVSFWSSVSFAIDPTFVLTSFEEDCFRAPLLEPEVMAASLAATRSLLRNDHISPHCLFFLRRALTSAANDASHEHDMDEIVHVLRDFLVLERDPDAPMRSIAERFDWFYDATDKHVDRPGDGDITTEWSLYNDLDTPYEDPMLTSGERAILFWEQEMLEDLKSADRMRKRIGQENLSNATLSAAISALRPLFATSRLHRRPGLFHAAQSLLSFIEVRSQSDALNLSEHVGEADRNDYPTSRQPASFRRRIEVSVPVKLNTQQNNNQSPSLRSGDPSVNQKAV